MRCSTMLFALVSSCLLIGAIRADEPPTRAEASRAMRKAVAFFREEVSTRGGYLWQYSADLKLREGEGKASATMAWVQPPGTPTVGAAYLEAFRLTGETYLVDAARETAIALVNGQLRSGGWDYRIEFDPKLRKKYSYRVDSDGARRRNTSTLDDDTTQAALRFLMDVDQALNFKDRRIHEATMFGLETLLEAQYPNGAWPQRFVSPPNSDDFPVRPASYPDTWSRTFPKSRYTSYYTFNDNTIADTITTMLRAATVYDDDRFRAAAEKAGDFIILAQMPEPQPAWAQQYDRNMCPAWARKFEPPAITGGEAQGVMRVLMTLYQHTGKKRFLAPIPKALDYLNRSRLPDGRLARFYELKTNKPLYFTKTYELTYSSDDMPTHYAFIVGAQLDSIKKTYKRLAGADFVPLEKPGRRTTIRLTRRLTQQAQTAIAQMDSRGAWVETGTLRYQEGPADNRIIRCQTFTRNLATLSEYVAATR